MMRNRPEIATEHGRSHSEIAPQVLCLQWPIRSSRRITACAALTGAAVIALLMSTHAFASSLDQAKRLNQEHHACAVVLRLNMSETAYQACVASLDRYLPPTDPPPGAIDPPAAQTTLQMANNACIDVGLNRNSPGYDGCVAEINEELSNDQVVTR